MALDNEEDVKVTTTIETKKEDNSYGKTIASESEREVSPARNPSSNIVFVRNLVRPFTLLQLKDLLEKTGKLVENQFWIDKIKSKCYATYETEEEAVKTRKALHGIRWPKANPKTLIVDFANKEELDYHLNLDKAPVSGKSESKKSESGNDLSNETKKSESRISNDKYDIAIIRSKVDEKNETEIVSRKDKREEKSDKSEREKRPIREWDRDKFVQKNDDETLDDHVSPNVKKRRESSPRSKSNREKVKEKRSKESVKGSETSAKDKGSKETDSTVKLLDDLFKKTKKTPCIYWLPLDEEQAKKRSEFRAELNKKREGEFAAREASRRNRFEERNRFKRSPLHDRRDRSPMFTGPRSFGRGGDRGSYSRRDQSSTQMRRRSWSRSRSSSLSRSRSMSSSRSSHRSRTRSRSPRKSPRKNGATYVRRSRSRERKRSRSTRSRTRSSRSRSRSVSRSPQKRSSSIRKR